MDIHGLPVIPSCGSFTLYILEHCVYSHMKHLKSQGSIQTECALVHTTNHSNFAIPPLARYNVLFHWCKKNKFACYEHLICSIFVIHAKPSIVTIAVCLHGTWQGPCKYYISLSNTQHKAQEHAVTCHVISCQYILRSICSHLVFSRAKCWSILYRMKAFGTLKSLQPPLVLHVIDTEIFFMMFIWYSIIIYRARPNCLGVYQ